MVDAETALIYFGEPPYYRHIASGEVRELPFRIKLADGSTRTDPTQWATDPEILSYAGFEVTTPTEADLEKRLPPAETVSGLRGIKLDELNTAWDLAVANGFYTSFGWRLKMANEDVTLLTGAFLLLKELHALDPQATTTIIDAEDVPHVVDLPTMTNLMLAYGAYRADLSGQALNMKQQILAASTLADLQALSIAFTLSEPPSV